MDNQERRYRDNLINLLEIGDCLGTDLDIKVGAIKNINKMTEEKAQIFYLQLSTDTINGNLSFPSKEQQEKAIEFVKTHPVE
jgi:hypothetical protein